MGQEQSPALPEDGTFEMHSSHLCLVVFSLAQFGFVVLQLLADQTINDGTPEKCSSLLSLFPLPPSPSHLSADWCRECNGGTRRPCSHILREAERHVNL